jgi:hypothetical protein
MNSILATDAVPSTGGAVDMAIVVIAVLVTAAGLSGLFWRRGRLRETTMMAVWWWSLAAFCAVAATEICGPLLNNSSSNQFTALCYAAAMLTFCPMMAVLGAKRPQSRSWPWIVLSLWLILLIPALHGWLHRPGESIYVFPAWQWLLLILLAVSVANYLPTRYWAAAVLAAIAQVLFISEHLPLGTFSPLTIGGVTIGPLLGLTALAAAIWLVHWGDARRLPPPQGIDQLWIDFRDAFGVVWAVRVSQQINAYSEMYGWQVTLSWDGLHTLTDGIPGTKVVDESQLDASTAAALRKMLRTTLRRFVPPEWIAIRLAAGDDDQTTTHR